MMMPQAATATLAGLALLPVITQNLQRAFTVHQVLMRRQSRSLLLWLMSFLVSVVRFGVCYGRRGLSI